MPNTCVSSASETALYVERSSGDVWEDFDNRSWKNERPRLDNLLIRIRQNPEYKAFFYIYVGSDETLDGAKKHIIKMVRHFKSRDKDFDAGRLDFALQKAERGHYTKFAIMDNKIDLPKCGDGCTLINGKHVNR